MFMKPKKFWLKIPFFIIISWVFLALFGLIVMILWNMLIPGLFHGPALSFWQSTGLLLLAWILIHGFPGSRTWGHRGRYDYRRHWKDKFEKMTPEERGKFREAWQKRCGSNAKGAWPWWDRQDQASNPAGHSGDPVTPVS